MRSTSDIVESSHHARPRAGYSAVRQGVEFLVCLGIAVSLCKTFAVETYMIETGSMAPGFFGWHREVTCPQCRWAFALGVEQDDVDAEAVCPNCGYGTISVPARDADSAHSENVAGDRVLVYKHFFDHRPPRRWEIAMFRNPGKPTENYVKRLAGLPGETIQIRDGDVYIDGEIQRKTLAQQRQMRIPVFDQDFQPPNTDHDWQPRWRPERVDSGWQAEEPGFSFRDRNPSSMAEAPLDWMVYRHWIRDSGLRTTTVPLAQWPPGSEPPNPYFSNVTYDVEGRRMICNGTMSNDARLHFLSLSPDESFQNSVNDLYEQSHLSTITDSYGYNLPAAGPEQPVRDLALVLRVTHSGGDGEFTVRMTDGQEIVDWRLDFGNARMELYTAQQADPIYECPLPQSLREGTAELEMSLMDRQLIVAVDGVPIGEPWTYPPSQSPVGVPQNPVQFGAAGVTLHVEGIRLFRDVYYQSKSNEAAFRPYQLGNDEYFALGDNSPISEDSRVWLVRPSARKLTSRHFVGRPFLVHLPSKKWRSSISIPDFSRIRYIR